MACQWHMRKEKFVAQLDMAFYIHFFSAQFAVDDYTLENCA